MMYKKSTIKQKNIIEIKDEDELIKFAKKSEENSKALKCKSKNK